MKKMKLPRHDDIAAQKGQLEFVYIMKSMLHKDVYKIGQTCNPANRLHAINVMPEQTVELYALYCKAVPFKGCGRHTEKELHRFLFVDKLHVSGEWFRLNQEVLENIHKFLLENKYQECRPISYNKSTSFYPMYKLSVVLPLDMAHMLEDGYDISKHSVYHFTNRKADYDIQFGEMKDGNLHLETKKGIEIIELQPQSLNSPS